MITIRVLSTAAAIALLLPMAAPTASFAQSPKAARGVSAGVHVGGSGGAPVARSYGGGAAPTARFNGGGGSPQVGAAPVARFNGTGSGAAVAGVSGGAVPQARFSDGRGDWRDGDRRRRGFGPGFAAGAIIGGAAIASQSYGYYGGPGVYYAPGYYDDQYYDAGPVAVAPAPDGDDAVAYCIQTYRSYDPASGTYLGNDGYRHPCP
jgi:hypothetical protein